MYLFIYLLFIRKLPKFHNCGVGAHQRQGKESKKSEEKERDLGTEGETCYLN